jgi:hypothetical protein
MQKVLGACLLGLVSSMTSLAGATVAREGGNLRFAVENAGSPEGDRRTGEPAKNENDAWRPRATWGFGGGATFTGTAGTGLAYRAMIGVEPKPWLFLGASYRGVHAEGRHYLGEVETFDTQLVTAALEIHPLGRFWADPYVSADVGYGHFSYGSAETRDSHDGDWGPDRDEHGLGAALGLGFALRTESFALGPQATLAYVSPLAISAATELRVDVRF